MLFLFITVAPTDFAFEALFESFEPEALDFLLTNPDVLSGILLYHVIPGRMFVDDFLNGLPMTTAAGTDVTIQRSAEQGLTVNQSRVIAGDFVAVNGVIHALDAVLIPPDFVPPQDLVDTAIAAGFDVLVTAVANAGLGDTLKSSGPFTVCKSLLWNALCVLWPILDASASSDILTSLSLSLCNAFSSCPNG